MRDIKIADKIVKSDVVEYETSMPCPECEKPIIGYASVNKSPDYYGAVLGFRPYNQDNPEQGIIDRLRIKRNNWILRAVIHLKFVKRHLKSILGR